MRVFENEAIVWSHVHTHQNRTTFVEQPFASAMTRFLSAFAEHSTLWADSTSHGAGEYLLLTVV